MLEPYRYAHLQQAAEASCQLFNAASLQDEHGRRVVMQVAASEQEFADLSWCADSDLAMVTFYINVFQPVDVLPE